MCLTFLPKDEEGTRRPGGIDWLAIGLLVAGLGALQTVLEEGQSDDWFASTFIRAFSVIAVVGIVAFIWRELRTKNPVVDLRVLKHRSLWAGSILSVVIGMALYGALFAVPIFAESIMHYTSQQVGMLLLPGALVSAVMMPLVAKLLGKYDARVLLVFGALILAGAVLQLSHMSPQTGGRDFFWPLILRAIGTVMMYLPLSMATLGPIPKKDVSAASGFYNLTRQLGGSIGVALLTTMLARRNAFHRSILVEKLGAIAPAVVERVHQLTGVFLAQGFPLADAQTKALAVLDGSVSLQASVLSFGDTFLATAVLIVITLPLVFLLGKVDRGSKVEMGH